MSQFDQIPDSYIDGIVKANQIGTPDPTKTSGVGLRELIKRLRDRVQAGGGVVTVNTFTDLTSPGDDDAIYITRDTRKEYRWDGTLASYVQLSLTDLSQLVPYIGATADVDLGSHNLNTTDITVAGTALFTGDTFTYQPANGNVLIDWNSVYPNYPYAFIEVHDPSNHSYASFIYAYKDQVLLQVDGLDGSGWIDLGNDYLQLVVGPNANSKELYFDATGLVYKSSGVTKASLDALGNLTANSFIKSGGTSNQFLKADGSVDNSTYLTTGGAGATYLPLSGGTVTGPIILPNTLPTNPLQAVSKSYIDNIITGLTWKNAVHVKTTGNITLSGLQTIDGVSLSADDRILVANQTDATQNGIYVAGTGAWARADDSNTGTEILKSTVMVEAGGIYANTQWTNTNTTVPVIGTDVISYTQISGAGTYTNGTGILLTANVFSLNKIYTDGLYQPLENQRLSTANNVAFADITATSFVKTGGTSSQFLMADGSLNDISNFVNTTTNQTVGGGKSFTGSITSTYNTSGGTAITATNTDVDGCGIRIRAGGSSAHAAALDVGSGAAFIAQFWNDKTKFYVPVEATSFVKTGGTSSQFLKADGSVDSNTYLTGSSANYIQNQSVSPQSASIWINGNFKAEGMGTFSFGISSSSISNTADFNQAALYLNSNGLIASRNINDGNTALTIEQAHSLSTGNIVDFNFAGYVVSSIDKNGAYNSAVHQLTVTGGVSGSIVASQPFSGASYKKVIVYLNSLNGSASYTFPTAFTQTPSLIITLSSGTSTASFVTTTAVTFSGNTNATGWAIIEGY